MLSENRENRPRKLTGAYIYLMLTAYILICAPYQYILRAKLALFLILSGGYCAAMIFLLIKDRVGFGAFSKPLAILSALYFILCCISAALSPYDYNAIIGMSRYEGLLTKALYLLSLNLVAAYGRLERGHVFALGAAMTAFFVLSAVQLCGLNPLWLYPEGMNYYDANIKYTGEYIGTLGNADFVSAMLAMAAAAFLAFLLFDRKKGHYFIIIPLILSVLLLFLIRVASGILAFAGAGAIIIVLFAAKKSKKLGTLALSAFAIIGIAALIAAYFYDFGGSGTLFELHELLHGRVSDTFGSGRFKIWAQILKEMPKHLWFGTGPDSMIAWDMEGFSRYYEAAGRVISRAIDAAHNEYLNVAAQEGLLAFVPAMGILGYCIAKKRSRTALAATVAYLISAFFGITILIVAPVFIIFLGITRDAGEICTEK